MRIITSSSILSEMRAKIHALKMMNLSFVEEKARSKIFQLINQLPSSEALLGLSEKPREMKMVSSQIGIIMKTIDDYGTNNKEKRDRYKAITGLEPRYRHLEWKTPKKACVSNLIKISSVVEKDGCDVLADMVLDLANRYASDEVKISDLVKVKNDLDLHSYSSESDHLLKYAVEMAVTGDMGEQLIGNIDAFQNMFGNMLGNIQNIVQRDSYNNNEYQKYNNVVKQVDEVFSQLMANGQSVSAAIQKMVSTQSAQVGQEDQIKASLATVTTPVMNLMASIQDQVSNLNNLSDQMLGEHNCQSITELFKQLKDKVEELNGEWESNVNDIKGQLNGDVKAMTQVDISGILGDFSKQWADFKNFANGIFTQANKIEAAKNKLDNYLKSVGIQIITRR